MTDPSLPPVRRIVTGINSEGRSCILEDGVSPAMQVMPGRRNAGARPPPYLRPCFRMHIAMAAMRGTNHAWANRSQTIARIAFVLIDGAR
jgi:hypothetical protein